MSKHVHVFNTRAEAMQKQHFSGCPAVHVGQNVKGHRYETIYDHRHLRDLTNSERDESNHWFNTIMRPALELEGQIL